MSTRKVGTDDTWAAVAATQVLQQRAQADEAAQAAEAERGLFAEVLTMQGPTWRAAFFAACGEAVALFNGKVGRELVRLWQPGEHHVSALAYDQGHWLAVVDLDLPDGLAPGVTLSRRIYGRDEARYFSLVRVGAGLALLIDGEPHTPEAAVRRLLEPWLVKLTLAAIH